MAVQSCRPFTIALGRPLNAAITGNALLAPMRIDSRACNVKRAVLGMGRKRRAPLLCDRTDGLAPAGSMFSTRAGQLEKVDSILLAAARPFVRQRRVTIPLRSGSGPSLDRSRIAEWKCARAATPPQVSGGTKTSLRAPLARTRIRSC